jgi:serine/threonine protein kinase
MNLSDEVLEHLRGAVSRPDLSGTRYEILDVIGRGGMGTVYRARDTQLDREVALKVIEIPAGDAQPMLGEARLLARLEHPGIVTVHDAGILPDGRAFCVMRQVEGQRLDAFLERFPSLSERLNVFGKLCDAVAFAHSRGVIHRDLKPENVMVGAFGEVIVLDWGVALPATGRHETGIVVGTSRYMPPEQRRGAEVDCRADIYALGVLLEQILPSPAPRPLIAIAAKASSPEPAARYSSVGEMAADVRRYQDRLPVSAYTEPPWEALARFAVRNRVLLLLLGTYALVRVVLFFLRPS